MIDECKPPEAYRHFLDWQQGNDNFGALIWRMIAKADQGNLTRLRVAFPVHCALYDEWRTSNTEEEFHQVWSKVK